MVGATLRGTHPANEATVGRIGVLVRWSSSNETLLPHTFDWILALVRFQQKEICRLRLQLRRTGKGVEAS